MAPARRRTCRARPGAWSALNAPCPLNSPQGKAILALARDGDYAHPGEAEAIRLAAARINRAEVRRLLDVGCGRGGSAAWFDRAGWGEVIGVDIDAESIDSASRRYPGLAFHVADVARLTALALPPVDLVYLLTAFYAFSDQAAALRQMRAVCRPHGQLLMMEYTRRADQDLPAELGREIGQPLVLDRLAAELGAAGWVLEHVDDWSDRFAGWYAQLLARFRQHEAAILQLAGPETTAFFLRWYGDLHRALTDRRLGGALVTARAVG